MPVGFLLLFLASSAIVAAQTALDNGLLGALLSSYNVNNRQLAGEPVVDCMEDRLKLTFRMEKPFTGRIFVKASALLQGMIDNPDCVRVFRGNDNQTVRYEIRNGECNMRRTRKLGPEERGVEQSTTVIVSFHDVFITRIDRAFRCTCFYMEADRVVTNKLEVSNLPTTELVDTARMPTCTYSVRKNSVNGPSISFAQVGDTVFHVWTCDSETYGIRIHDCFTDSGNGNDRRTLLDEQGCSTDPIFADLQYNNLANLAYSEGSVFKFADKTTVYVQCSISLCMRSEGMCQGRTPPRCGAVNRHRRAPADRLPIELDAANETTARRKKAEEEMTVDLTEKIVVLDLDDAAVGKSAERSAALKRLNDERAGGPSDRVCFSLGLLVLTACLLSLIFVAGVGSLAVFLWRARRKSSKF
ncbi:Zona pellucida domain-containing protein [Aphelenchoides fujianensis]|nr:Zona pellucida domain-containing protein [Aphelenchoides fujianensis]